MSDYFTAPTAPESGSRARSALISDLISAVEDGFDALPAGLTADDDVGAHEATTDAHSSTAAATADRIVLRDSQGRAKIANPSVDADITNKGSVDTLIATRTANLRNIQYFTASDTYTKPSWLKFAIVEVQGAGGGGAGCGTTDGQVGVGRGGCAGGYGKSKINAGDIGATETVTIGAGGNGATSGDATDGEASSFGEHITANGGAGGNGVNNVTGERYVQSQSGAGASGGNILNIRGGGVEAAWCSKTLNLAIASQGGDSVMGRGGRALIGDGVTAGGGSGYGSGGGGAGMRDGDTTNSSGGDGAGGNIIVYEYE
jgi:hypothetical protein